MSIEKLELVSISGELPLLDDAIVACLQSKTFHLENAAKLLGSSGNEESGGSHTPEVNPYAEPLKHLTELDLRRIAIDVTKEPLPAEFTPEQIIAETDRIAGSLRSIQDRLRTARQQVADYESAEIHLKYLQESDLDLGELRKAKHILYRFGRMPEENVQKLDFYSEQGFIFQTCHTESEYVWGFYFAKQERIMAVDAIMKGLLFEQLHLPEELSGTPQEGLEELQIRIKGRRSEIASLEKEEAEIYSGEAELLSKMYRFAKYQSEVFKLRGQCIIMRDKFSLMGYVPIAEKEQFKKYIDKVPNLTVTYEKPWTDSKVQPPVRLKSGWFSRPFSMFVEMYGLPNYSGYNPTTFVAITYTLLFGIMFGDLGQGIVLALLGVFLHRKKNFELGAIMARIGVSSAIFGALFGSVFGFEEALDPFYESLGISFLPLKAMDSRNTNLIIYGAVGIGAALIVISILVNIIVKLRRHNYEEAIFGNNGIAGLVFFSGLLLAVLGIVTGEPMIPKGGIVLLLLIPLLMMFFREPLGHWAAHKPYHSEGIGDFIAANFFECFEFLLGYVSNTLSFIRVGGFVFSHAGLMSVVMMLAETEKGGTSIPVVIIGNAIVMCLEGLIVGIQVLRLEFYEIFSRCYDGDGKPFTPIAITFDDFSETQQDETAVKA